jgi:flavin reductase (DIM6/NTAB) family NADH-FMN oxidoreductase RutF
MGPGRTAAPFWACLPALETGCAAWLGCRLIPEPHTEDAYDACFGKVVTAAADARIFKDAHWSFRDDNVELQTIHQRRCALARA